MPIGIGANPIAVAQAYPGAAQKGGQDQTQLQKKANDQVEAGNTQQAVAVSNRQKPVAAREGSAQARMDQQKQDQEQQRALIEGGQAMKLEKMAGKLSIYA